MAESIAQQFDNVVPLSPEPLPLAADSTRPAEYPVEALGKLLAGAVAATVDHSFVPVSIAAQSCLAACSLAVQAHFDVVLPTGSTRPSTLHLVSMAESGDRKSASDEYVMAPIWAYQDELEALHREQKATAQLQQNAWDEAKKAVTQRLKNSGREALEQGYRDLGRRPDGPIDPVLVLRVGTTQALLDRFLTGRPSMGLMSDEGGSWLGGYGMSEDNRLHTITTLSDFWDGKTQQINTVGKGFSSLRGARLAFHLMLQPILASRLLGNAEAQGQGFLSRLLVAQPESLAGTRIVDPDKRAPAELRAAMDLFRDRLSQIIRVPLPVAEGERTLTPRAIPFSDQAKRMWWAFYNSIETRLAPDRDLVDVKGFAGKLPEQAARLAVTMAAVERGATLEEVDAETLARGIKLAEFYLSEAQRLFGKPAVDPVIADAQVLSNWLRTTWTENLISASAVRSYGPSKLRVGADYIRQLIDVLVRHDHLSERLSGGGMVSGKKVREVWRVQVRNG